MKLYFKQLELGPLQNFVYLLGSLETREAAVIDPAWDVPKILETAAQDEMRITHIIITHTHFDHINGVADLLKKTDAQVLVHKKEISALPIEKTTLKATEGGHSVSLGPIEISFLHTPGHTPGSQCMTVADRLIAGDTLFVGGCGRCDLPGGDPEALYQSLTRLSRLDDRVTLYPGHHYATSPSSILSEEKSANPFLQAKSVADFFHLVGLVKRNHVGQDSD